MAFNLAEIQQIKAEGAMSALAIEGVSGDGTTDCSKGVLDITTAISNMGGGTVHFPKGTYRFALNVTLPAGVTLSFSHGAILAPDSGVTLTVNSSIDAGLWQIFGGSGSFAGDLNVTEIYPQWWGCVLDGSTDNTVSFSNMIKSNPNGAKVFISAGTLYIGDENNLPSKIQNFSFEGTYGLSEIFFGQVCGTSTSSAPSAANVPNWIVCRFHHVILSALNAGGYAMFTSGSQDLRFHKCIFQDVTPFVLQGTGRDITFVGCKFLTKNAANGTCLMGIGNVTQNFRVIRCDFNFPPAQGAGTLIAATNASNLIGNYWFLNNRFLDDQYTGYYIDAAIDLEPNSSSQSLINVHIEGNTIYNSKLYIGGVEELWFTKNYMRMTSILGASSAPASPVIEGRSAYSTAPLKYLEITDNIIICDDYATYEYKQPINFNETNTIERLVIRDNTLQANGKLNASPESVISINASGGTINHLEIENNYLSYSSVPSSLYGAIYVVTQSSGTVNHINIKDNKLAGVPSASSALLQETNGGTATTIETLIMSSNDVTEGTPSSFIAGSSNSITNRSFTNNPGDSTAISTPSLPTSGTTYKNNTGYDVQVSISGGTVTGVAIGSTSTGLTSGMFLVRAGQTITPTYSSAPSWVWTRA